MTDRIPDRHASRDIGKGGNGRHVHDEDEVDDLGTFGFLRGSKERATMLELRKKDGSVLAVGYGWIEKVSFDPTDGITLHVVEQRIRIRGRNLNGEVHPKVRLFEAVCRHRVPWLREADRATDLAAGNNDAIVESIEW